MSNTEIEFNDVTTERNRRDARQTSRQTRAQESRAGDDWHDETQEQWELEGLLDMPFPPRPGYVQRWVRTKLNGEDDVSNFMRRTAAGWRPRKADTVPAGASIPTTVHEGSNVIGVMGMILCERPIKVAERERASVRELTRAQETAVREDLYRVHEPGSGMGRPFMQSTARVTRGRPAPVADD